MRQRLTILVGLMGLVAALGAIWTAAPGADYPTTVHTFATRQDKSTTGYTIVDERVTVPASTPYTGYLQQVPKSGTVPVATYELGGASLARTETNPPAQAGYYYVDYATGTLAFHSGDASKAILFDYTGIGTLIRAGHLNEIQGEIVAIETELGTDPSGDFATVDARLDAITSGTVSVGDADTVDGLHASGSPVAGSLYPLGVGAVYPAGVLPATVAYTGVDNDFDTTQTATAWAGDGGGLTGLNATELTTGTVPLARLPGVVARTDQPTSFAYGLEAASAHILGKLTVDGEIDPTALILDNQASAPTVAVGKTGLYTDTAGTAWILRGGESPDAIARKPARTIVVSATGGGDYTTIGEAITAAEALGGSGTIQVFAGTYAEGGLEIPDGWSVVGVDAKTCVIEAVGDYEDPMGNAASSALVFVPFNSSLANVTVSNTYSGGYAAAVTVAAYINDATGNLAGAAGDYYPVVRNCTIKSASTFALCVLSDSYAIVEGCDITGGMYSLQATAATRPKYIRRCVVTSTFTTAGTGDESPLWLGHSGDLHFEFCKFQAADSGEGGCFIDDNNTDGLNIYFRHCQFLRGAAYDSPSPVMTGNPKAGSVNVAIGLNGCVYSAEGSADPVLTWATENLGDGDKSMDGGLAVTGGFASSGSVLVTSSTLVTFGDVVRFNQGSGSWGGLEFYDGGTADWNVGLARGDGDDTLHLPSGNFDVGGGITASGTVDAATGFTVNTVEAISSTREGKFAGLSTTATQWRYFDAVSASAGDRAGSAGADAWLPSAAPDAQYMVGAIGDLCLYFLIPYEAGTVITRVSARWQGEDSSAGVILTLQKRQGGTSTAAWATVGAAQTYTGDTETNSVYDLADETMTAGYSYRLMARAVVVTNPTRLWEIGVETSKRAY